MANNHYKSICLKNTINTIIVTIQLVRIQYNMNEK